MASQGALLIRRMADGDRDACAAFYDAYAPLAWGLLRRMFAGAEVEGLLSRAVLDSSADVRTEASLALKAAGYPLLDEDAGPLTWDVWRSRGR